MKKQSSILPLLSLSVGVVLIFSSCSQKHNWPQFRGTESNMVSSAKNLPDEWSDNKNVSWKYKIEGAGWSSPVVWGNKIFIVSAFPENVVSDTSLRNQPPMDDEDEDEENDSVPPVRTPPQGGPGAHPGQDQNPPPPPPPNQPDNDTSFMKDVYRWEVTCIDLNTGKELWKQVSYKGNPKVKKHSLNSYASETPVTDGKRLYAYFGMTGLFCYDLNGKLLWQKDMAGYKTQNEWGTGSSPVVFEDILYIQNDNEENSFVVALDAATGTEKWKAERKEKTTYATPFIWKNRIRNELVLLGKTAISYDLKSGNVLWQMKIGGGQIIPSPVADANKIYMGNPGGRLTKGDLFAINAGAEGDITPPDSLSTNSFISWTLKDADLGNGSPLLYKGYLYFLASQGRTLSCLNSETGKQIYKQKIKRLGAIWASPWAYADRICFYDEKGATRIIKAGEKFELLAENKIKDKFWASVAITDNGYIFKGVDWIYKVK
jgi:outer membrane protein assembly factor BamB